MKFFSWLTTILIVAAIVAAFTAPSDKKFADFISKDKGGDTMACKPIVGKTTTIKLLVKLFSIHYVNYCELSKTQLGKPAIRLGGIKQANGDSAAITIGRISLPKITRSETYLGLFGKFWKL